MKVSFRVDASVRMGTGHVMRCLSLAESLRERGVQVHFICREHTGNLVALMRQKALPVTVLPAPAMNDATTGKDYAVWLGVTQAEDAKQTIEALNGERPDWLVVDHYGLDVEWEQRLRSHASKLMVIDDLANRHHDCDVLLDQNYSLVGERRYSGFVPETCKILVGPRNALVHPEYAAYRRTMPARDGQVRRVLVFFGGSDPQNMTGMALEAISDPTLNQLEVDVVVGANNVHRESLENQAKKRPGTRIYGPRPHLADLMSQADLAIGAGGASTWERMCLGLPAVVVSIAENQRPASEALAAAKLIYYAGDIADIKVNDLKQLLMTLTRSIESLAELTMRNQREVDGLGALRLAEVMSPSATHEIRLRPTCEEDVVFYYNWANDPEVQKNAVDTSTISWATHQAWFSGKLGDLNTRLFVLEASGLPVGHVQFVKEGVDARIDYSLDSIARGRNWDSRLVALGLNMMQQIEPVRLRSEVLDRNDALSAAFLFMGSRDKFQALGAVGERRSIAILSDRTSWMNEYIHELLMEWLIAGHRVLWVHDQKELRSGDFCFYLSCGQIVPAETLSLFRHNLVVHESDLPRGKGWSPLTWQILEGRNRIPVTLFEAAETVDSGVIYEQEWLEFEGHELIEELRQMQGAKTLELCTRFLYDYPTCTPTPQSGVASFYRRRIPADSRLDPDKTIREQFNLLRIVDNERYPAFLEFDGCRYQFHIMRLD
jgi:UDP-2,4-diacetamido-2,4,6-trideoxy-beta-L-altropyranose hydrolase